MKNIETIANTTPRKGLLYLHKAKQAGAVLFKHFETDKESIKDLTFADFSTIIDRLIVEDADNTLQFIAYMFCCETEEQLNKKVEFLDMILPLWEIWNYEPIQGFFKVLLSLGNNSGQE